MNGNGKEKLTEKQVRIIPFLLGAPSMEEACKQAKISKVTVYGWLKEDTFREELRKQRDEVVRRALEALQANVTKATKTLVKHLDSKHENISIRAAESIIAYTQKVLEHDELERRIEALEEKLSLQVGNHR